MINKWIAAKDELSGKGQSLVELALFFPVLLIILAGIVEVSNLLNTQNKVTTAARLGAGYGANNVTDDDVSNWSDPSSRAYDMGRATINAITQTLETNPEFWSVFSIYAETNSDGSIFDVFTYTQSFGNNDVITWDQWLNEVNNEIYHEMLAEINSWPEGAGDLPVVSTVAYHNVDAILGIPVLQWTGLSQIQSMTVMRLSDQDQLAFGACTILPITVRLDQYSLYPHEWDSEVPPGGDLYMYPTGVTTDTAKVPIFPEELDSIPQTRWDYPVNQPSYVIDHFVFTDTNPIQYAIADPNLFPSNYPGVRLQDAFKNYSVEKGYKLLYLARQTGPAGSFGWLDWTAESGSEPDLATSLTWPGDLTGTYPLGKANDITTRIGDGIFDIPPCFPNGPDGECNGVLERKEWVRTSTGNINADPVQEQLQCYVDMAADAKKKGGSFKAECVDTPEVVLLVYTEVVEDKKGGGQPGFNAWYRVEEFIRVNLRGYYFGNQPDERWLMFEYLGVANDCFPTP